MAAVELVAPAVGAPDAAAGATSHAMSVLVMWMTCVVDGWDHAVTDDRACAGFQAGDRVLVCDRMPCGRCGACVSGRMVYCTDTSGKQRQRTRLSLDGQPFRQYLGVSALAELMLVDTAGLLSAQNGA